jgi:transposase
LTLWLFDFKVSQKCLKCRPWHLNMGQKLLEMQGVGPVIAGVLVSELFPVARVAPEPRSATYSGVTPLARKSGKSLDKDRLTQGVNKRVLHALYTSSVVAIKNSAVDRAYYQKKLRFKCQAQRFGVFEEEKRKSLNRWAWHLEF